MIVKDKKTRTKKAFWITATVVVILVGLGGTAYAYWLNTDAGKEAQSEVTQNKTDSQNKKDYIESTNKGNDSPTEGTASVPPNDPANITITTRGESNGTLTILIKLVGYSDGECSLGITNGNNQYNETAAVIFQPEYSTCAGFSVDKAKLGGSGTWKIRLTVTSKGVQVVKEETVTVQ